MKFKKSSIYYFLPAAQMDHIEYPSEVYTSHSGDHHLEYHRPGKATMQIMTLQ